jgi:hypothetical protein
MALLSLMLAQVEARATKPEYFVWVVVTLLIAGGIGWLVAAVLGFARARAFGSSTRWFAFAAVCLIVYHIQFLLIGVLAMLSATGNDDMSAVLNVGAFFNLFIVLGAVCAIMGFLRLTDPR